VADRGGDLFLRIALAIDELDRHPLLCPRRLAFAHDALDLAMDRQRVIAAGHEQLEHEFRANRKRAARLDERATTRDVLGVVSEERVEPLVFDLELDRAALATAA